MFICLNWRDYLEESKGKRIVIVVGIPGVGKSTVISRANELLKEKEIDISTVIFGTLMFEKAKSKGITSRDEMRSLSINEQKELQRQAAMEISEFKDNYVVIDTHLFIKTPEGYYPGLPYDLLKIINPNHFVLILASSNNILSRRTNDLTRKRDIISEDDIQDELDIAMSMVSSSALLSGAPFTIINNEDNKVDKAAMMLSNIILGANK